MADSPEAIKKACKTYKLVFFTLLVCTVLTVLVAKVEFLDFGKRGFDTADAVLGLAIATLKASLVGFIFMHLNHEKKMIYFFFGMAIFFAVAMYALSYLAEEDVIHYSNFFGRE